MMSEPSRLDELLETLATSALEPHGEYKMEFSNEDQKIIYEYIKKLEDRYSIRSKAYNNTLLENSSLGEEISQKDKIVEEAMEELTRALTFCVNDSQGAYDVCNRAIKRDKKILDILNKYKGCNGREASNGYKKALERIRYKMQSYGGYDGESCTRSYEMWAADFNYILSLIDYALGDDICGRE